MLLVRFSVEMALFWYCLRGLELCCSVVVDGGDGGLLSHGRPPLFSFDYFWFGPQPMHDKEKSVMGKKRR